MIVELSDSDSILTIDHFDIQSDSDIEHAIRLIQSRELSGDQRTVEWLQQRHQFITGSAVKKCCAPNDTMGKLDSLLEKIDQPEVANFRGNKYTVEGHILEPVSRDLYLARLRDKGHRYKWYEFGLVRHPTIEWAAASTDGVCYFPATGKLINIEIKSLRSASSIRPPDKLDKGYYAQLQWQMFCLELNETDFIQTYIELSDTAPITSNYQGQILECAHSVTGENIYLYSPVSTSEILISEWAQLELNNMQGSELIYIRTLYWTEQVYSQLRLARDQVLIDQLVHAGVLFWERVQKGRTSQVERQKIIDQRNQGRTKKSKGLPLLVGD